MTAVTSAVEEIRTLAGVLRRGNAFHFRRPAKSGWLQARTFDPDGRWITGTDKNGLVRTVRVEHVTLIDRKRVVWTPHEEYKPPSRKGR